ncbi:MAG: ABC transporter permease subunit [Myxococcaceae bacterium]|nr:ABC transporter permease subunit [Myxococcaceae bacterium]MCI0669198.1 ABC transporter permease subunit [Myxococcaceae bacterium]
MVRLTLRVLRDAALIPLTALLAYQLVALLPLKPDADSKNESLRSISRQLEADLGLGQPWGFLRPWQKLVAGERLGHGERSYTGAEVGRALLGSLRIGGLGLLFALGLGVAWALGRVVARERRLDGALQLLPSLVYATPTFVLALGVALLTGLAAGDEERAAFEPVAALVVAVGPAAFVGTVLHDALRAELARPYALAAKARGRGAGGVLLRHALPNAFLAVLDALPPVATALLAGSFVAEKLFNVTYFGFLYVDAARNKQLALVVIATTVFASLLLLVSLATDVLRFALDPQARRREGRP